jgi:hypothetical protein
VFYRSRLGGRRLVPNVRLFESVVHFWKPCALSQTAVTIHVSVLSNQ